MISKGTNKIKKLSLFGRRIFMPLIPPENIPRINLPRHIVQATVIAVGDDGVALLLELDEVVHHSTAEERAALLQRGCPTH